MGRTDRPFLLFSFIAILLEKDVIILSLSLTFGFMNVIKSCFFSVAVVWFLSKGKKVKRLGTVSNEEGGLFRFQNQLVMLGWKGAI